MLSVSGIWSRTLIRLVAWCSAYSIYLSESFHSNPTGFWSVLFIGTRSGYSHAHAHTHQPTSTDRPSSISHKTYLCWHQSTKQSSLPYPLVYRYRRVSRWSADLKRTLDDVATTGVSFGSGNSDSTPCRHLIPADSRVKCEIRHIPYIRYR